jgi:predicted transposase/invertase (TIGR01784 family)
MGIVAEKQWDYNSDQAIKEQLRAEEEWRRGYNSAVAASKEEGIAEGKAEANKETAKKLLELGIDVEIISKSTGLSLEEISKL